MGMKNSSNGNSGLPKEATKASADEERGPQNRRKLTATNDSATPAERKTRVAKVEQQPVTTTPKSTTPAENQATPPHQQVDEELLAGFTDSGTRYGELNQDDFFFDCLSSEAQNGGRVFVIGVFDGHGKHGETASRLAGEFFREKLRAHLTESKSNSMRAHEKVVFKLFEDAHERIIEEYESLTELHYEGYDFKLREAEDRVSYYTAPSCPYILLQDFGTTAVICIYWESTGQLLVANCGDSEAVLGRYDRKEGTMRAELLTVNDNVYNNVDEQRRIRQDFRNSVFENGYLCPKDPVYGFHRLAMTRALGHHFLKHYGVVHTPHIRTLTVRPEDIVLVVATDGLFDVVNYDAVLTVAAARLEDDRGGARHLKPRAACQKIVEMALENWKCYFGPNTSATDNVAVCLLKLSTLFDEEMPAKSVPAWPESRSSKKGVLGAIMETLSAEKNAGK